MKEEKKVFGGDGCHWYDKDANPMHEVLAADGKKMVKTTLRQARKLNLFPSVTSIFKLINKSGLNEWKMNHLLKVVQKTGITGSGLSLAEFKTLLLSHCEDEMTSDRDEGTEIHKEIEQFLKRDEKPVDDKHYYICSQVRSIIANCFNEIVSIDCEIPVVNLKKVMPGQ